MNNTNFRSVSKRNTKIHVVHSNSKLIIISLKFSVNFKYKNLKFDKFYKGSKSLEVKD